MIFDRDKELRNFGKFLCSFKSDFEKIALIISIPLFWGLVIFAFYEHIPKIIIALYAFYAGASVWIALAIIPMRQGGILRYFFVCINIIAIYIIYPGRSAISIQTPNDPLLDYFKLGIWGASGLIVFVGVVLLVDFFIKNTRKKHC